MSWNKVILLCRLLMHWVANIGGYQMIMRYTNSCFTNLLSLLTCRLQLSRDCIRRKLSMKISCNTANSIHTGLNSWNYSLLSLIKQSSTAEDQQFIKRLWLKRRFIRRFMIEDKVLLGKRQRAETQFKIFNLVGCCNFPGSVQCGQQSTQLSAVNVYLLSFAT